MASASAQFLSDVSPKGLHAVFERFRSILHEAQIDKRYVAESQPIVRGRQPPLTLASLRGEWAPPGSSVQYMIEVLFQVRKEKFKDHPAVPEELDLVEEEEQITHYLTLDEVRRHAAAQRAPAVRAAHAERSCRCVGGPPTQDLDPEEMLDVFQYDPNYLENEAKYKEIKAEILVRPARPCPKAPLV